jgi:flagellar basal-body rod protein FlgB
MNIDDKTMQALAASLKYRQLRQELIASNIANAETPGYKAKKIDFEEALARALDTDDQMNMKVQDGKHYNVGNGGFKNLSPEIYEDPNGIVSLDGNNVDRDQEMAEMAENKLMFDASVQLLNKKLGLLKYAIGSDNR